MNGYVINGESYLLINEAINDIIKDNKNVVVFDLINDTLDSVLVEAGYYSFLEEKKYIIVKNANFLASGKLSEELSQKLINYIKEPNPNSVLIFVVNEGLDNRKKITKVVKEKYKVIKIANLKSYEIVNRVRDMFRSDNFNIDLESIKYIVANSLNNYDMVWQEVEKIKLYFGDKKNISFEEIRNIVAKAINTNNFLFVDEVVSNNLEGSIRLLEDLKTMKVEPTVLISLLARDFRYILNVKILQNKGVREDEIMNKLGLLDWQLDKYLKKAFIYKIKELEEIIIKLSEIDLDIKRGVVDKFLGLKLFILDICA